METLLLIVLICTGVLAVLFFLKPRSARGMSPRARLERTVQSRRAKYPAASRAELLEVIDHEYVRDRS